MDVASGRANSDARDYIKGKRQSTTQAAFQRAETRLASVSPGMSQNTFMATVEMTVLSRDGQPVDAWVDGYLGPAPAALLARPLVEGERSLLFGYEDETGQHPRVIVIFTGDSLSEILPLDQPEMAAGRETLSDSHT